MVRPSTLAALALVTLGRAAGAQPSAAFGDAAPAAPAPGAAQNAYTGPEHYEGINELRTGDEAPDVEARPCRPEQPGFAPYVRRPECATLPYDAAPAPVRAPKRARGGPRFHDGLYARLGFTLGGARDTMTSDRAQLGDWGTYRDVEVKQGGVTPGTHVALGFSPTAGLALALSLETATIVAGVGDSFRFRGGNHSDRYVYKTAQLELVGPLLDWYPWPQRGLHFQASPGLAVFIAGQGDTPGDAPRLRAHTALGWGVSVAAGYEFWIGEEWSLGLLGRLLYSATDGRDAPGNDWSHRMLAPAIGLTTTYH